MCRWDLMLVGALQEVVLIAPFVVGAVFWHAIHTDRVALELMTEVG